MHKSKAQYLLGGKHKNYILELSVYSLGFKVFLHASIIWLKLNDLTGKYNNVRIVQENYIDVLLIRRLLCRFYRVEFYVLCNFGCWFFMLIVFLRITFLPFCSKLFLGVGWFIFTICSHQYIWFSFRYLII